MSLAFSPSGSSIPFPEELKKIWLSSNLDSQQQVLNASITETVRREFTSWACQHDAFVKQSPLLRHICKMVNSDYGVTQTTEITTELFCDKIEKRTYNFLSPENFHEIQRNMALIQEYHKIGIIAWNQLVQILSLSDGKEYTFTKFLPLLDTLSLPQLIEVLSIQDLSGVPVFHYTSIFQLVISYLINQRKCSPDELVAVLSIADSKGQTPLHFRTNFVAFTSFLEKIAPRLLVKILSLQDQAGVPVLHAQGVFFQALSSIADLVDRKSYGPHLFCDALSILDREGHLPLFSTRKAPVKKADSTISARSAPNDLSLLKVVKEIFTDPKECATPESRKPLFSTIPAFRKIPNDPGPYNLIMFLPLLQKLPFEQLIEILSIQDASGSTVMHDHTRFPYVIWAFATMKKPTDQVLKLLSLPDKNGRLPPHIHENFTWILQKWSHWTFIKLFALKNSDGVSALHCPENFKKAIPHFVKQRKCTQEQLLELLSILDSSGKTTLDCLINAAQSLPFLKELPVDLYLQMLSTVDKNGLTILDADIGKAVSFFVKELKCTPEQLVALLSIRNQLNNLSISDRINFTACLPRLLNMPFTTVVKVFSIQDRFGRLVFHSHFEDVLERCINWRECTHEQLMEILSLFDLNGRTALHFSNNFKSFIPYLTQMPFAQALKILSIQQRNGCTNLQERDTFKRVMKLYIERSPATPEQLVELLSILDRQGHTPLHFLNNFELFLEYFPNIPLEQSLKILSLQDPAGLTVLHYPHFFKVACDKLLGTLSRNDLEQVLALSDRQKNSVLHNRYNYREAASLLCQHSIDPSQFVNDEGLSALDLATKNLSPAWLALPKTAPSLQEAILMEDYKRRVSLLQSRVEDLWKTVDASFKIGELSPHILYSGGKHYSPDEVIQSLQEMLAFMPEQTVWKGTPKTDEPEALHLFYSTMLVNFERIVSQLEKTSLPSETAGHLMDIAVVRLVEKRCATGCQSELEQKSDLLTDDSCDLETMMARAASRVLRLHINTIVSGHYFSNVHASNQLYYVSGLAKQADPYALDYGLTEEAARKVILDTFDPLAFYREFGRKISNEVASDWLQLHTPDDFQPELRDSMKEEEEKLFKGLQTGLLRTLPAVEEKQIEQLAYALRGMHAPTCVTTDLHTAEKSALLEQACKESTRVDPFLDTLDTSLPYEELKEKIEEAARAYQRKFPKDTEYFGKLRRLSDTKGKLFREIEAIFKFHKLMEEYQIPPQKHLAILRLKQVDQSGIEILGEILTAHGISYVAKSQGLPSQACEDARRHEYNKHILDKRGKMLEQILLRMGVTV